VTCGDSSVATRFHLKFRHASLKACIYCVEFSLRLAFIFSAQVLKDTHLYYTFKHIIVDSSSAGGGIPLAEYY